MAENCAFCKNGFMGSDVECINGVLIDIDEFTEGWTRDAIYPPAPCHPKYCGACAGTGDAGDDDVGFSDCEWCGGTGYLGGVVDCQSRLEARCFPPTLFERVKSFFARIRALSRQPKDEG